MDPRFTVYQIIAEPIRNFRKLSKKEEEREINDLLTMMELPEEIKLRKAHELSGGQQKRVCIARALAAQPDVLIFDEAVSGLDVLVRKHILDLLKRLHQERKMTCFFITHDLDVALYLADRVMVMRCGKHFVAYFLAALFASFTRCLYRCPKSLEVVSWYWSFCHSYSPSYILLFPFLLGYVYTIQSVSQNNSYVYVDN